MCNKWRSIETAPRDGTWFLAGRAGEGLDACEVGCYDPTYMKEYVEVGAGLFKEEQRIVYEWRGFNNMPLMTHWMPLPAPPPGQGRE